MTPCAAATSSAARAGAVRLIKSAASKKRARMTGSPADWSPYTAASLTENSEQAGLGPARSWPAHRFDPPRCRCRASGALETDAPSMNSSYSAYFRLVPIRRTVAALSGSSLPRSTFRHFPVTSPRYGNAGSFNGDAADFAAHREQTQERDEREDETGEERACRAVGIPERPGDDARREHRNTGQQIEISERRSAQLGGRCVGNQGGKQALGKSHVQAPQRNADGDAAKVRHQGQRQIGACQHDQSRGKQSLAIEAVGQHAGGIGRQRINDIHPDENDGHPGQAQPDILGAQDQEGFAETSERKHDTDDHHAPVDLSEALERLQTQWIFDPMDTGRPPRFLNRKQD